MDFRPEIPSAASASVARHATPFYSAVDVLLFKKCSARYGNYEICPLADIELHGAPKMVINLDGNWRVGKAYDLHTLDSTYPRCN
jgi:hypothetical protein